MKQVKQVKQTNDGYAAAGGAGDSASMDEEGWDWRALGRVDIRNSKRVGCMMREIDGKGRGGEMVRLLYFLLFGKCLCFGRLMIIYVFSERERERERG